jgi:hypothetical protein
MLFLGMVNVLYMDLGTLYALLELSSFLLIFSPLLISRGVGSSTTNFLFLSRRFLTLSLRREISASRINNAPQSSSIDIAMGEDESSA